jgi:hypothetical protein
VSAAEGHEADDVVLLSHAGVRPVTVEGHEAEGTPRDFKPERDPEILRSIKTLATINGKPAKEFWKEVDAGKR